MVNKSNDTEQNERLEIINSLLTTPHGELTTTDRIHNSILSSDPLFYVRLAVWYCDPANGQIRDHKHVFIGNLLTCDIEEGRDAGYVLLQDLPPHEAAKVIKYITTVMERWTKHGIPTSTQTAIKTYLRTIEANESRFDGAAVRHKKFMRYLYKMGKTTPTKRAKNILFEGKYPRKSLPYYVKMISKAKSPTKQAELIVKHDITYAIASTIIKKITPTVLVALINSMSSQELISNMGSIKKHGAYDNEDVKNLIKSKLKEAKTDKKVSGAMKTRKATAIANVDKDIEKALDAVGDAQVKAKGEIKRPTCLIIDKSGSMNTAIEVGRQIASIISAICVNGLWVYATDRIPILIESEGDELSDWERATAHISAGGGTSIGAPLKAMIADGIRVEQFVLVTDEKENALPPFAGMKDPKSGRNIPGIITKYCNEFGVEPNVYIIHPVKGKYMTKIHDELDSQGIVVDSLDFDGDYYSLMNLIPLLTRPSQLDLLIEVMSYPLPKRTDRSDKG